MAAIDTCTTQHYCCVVLPDFDDGLLPPGIYEVTWEVLVSAFGFNDKRRWLLDGLLPALLALRSAGCVRAYIDGSFVTQKELPGDYDLCWDIPAGLEQARLDPVLADLAAPRLAQHVKYRGDILPNIREGNSGMPFVDFFQVDKVTGQQKGILTIDLRGLK